jgi:hypothetical protein
MRAKEFLFEKTWSQRIADTNPTAFDDKEIAMPKDKNGANTKLTRDQIKKMGRITRRMETDPGYIEELFHTLQLRAADNEGNIKDRIELMLDPKNTQPEKDQVFVTSFLRGLALAIESTDGTPEERIEFANTFGKVDHVDAGRLTQPGPATWNDWLIGTEFSKRLFHTCFNAAQFKIESKGPGEVALALFTPDIKLRKGKGDISVNGVDVELKAGETSSGGRLAPTANVIGNLYNNKEFWQGMFPNWNSDPIEANKFKILTATDKVNHNNYGNFLSGTGKFKRDFALDNAQSKAILKFIFSHTGAQSLVNAAAAKGPSVTPLDLAKIAHMNYGKSQGDENILIVQKDISSSLFYKIDDLDSIWGTLSITLPLIDHDSRTYGRAQVGILKGERKA